MSILKVAKHAGVSKSTVSLVLNNSPLVAVATARVVRSAMKEIGYVPPPRNKRRGRKARASFQASESLNIVVMTIDFPAAVLRAPFYSDIQHGVYSYLQEHGHRLSLHHTTSDSWRLKSLDNVDGFLVMGRFPQDFQRELSTRAKSVAVAGVDSPRNFGCDWVGHDDVAGGKMAAEYLLMRGHRRLAYIGPADWLRAKSFAETVKAGGAEFLAFESNRLIQRSDEIHEANRSEIDTLVDRLVALKQRPTGIFVWADILTPTLISCLISKGIQPDRDVFIISCNNEWPHLVGLRPRPAVVDLQAVKIGRRAAEQLLWRLRNRNEPQMSLMLMPRISPESRMKASD